jgi:hypothetical protein
LDYSMALLDSRVVLTKSELVVGNYIQKRAESGFYQFF